MEAVRMKCSKTSLPFCFDPTVFYVEQQFEEKKKKRKASCNDL